MIHFLSINFFFLDFFNFCWVFQKSPFCLCHPLCYHLTGPLCNKQSYGFYSILSYCPRSFSLILIVVLNIHIRVPMTPSTTSGVFDMDMCAYNDRHSELNLYKYFFLRSCLECFSLSCGHIPILSFTGVSGWTGIMKMYEEFSVILNDYILFAVVWIEGIVIMIFMARQVNRVCFTTLG